MPPGPTGLLRRLQAQMVYTSLQVQVLDFIRNPDPAGLEALALSIFAHQFRNIEPYRRFCQTIGLIPGSVSSIAEIPAVSTAAFKYAALCAGTAQRIFLTSGTTRGR